VQSIGERLREARMRQKIDVAEVEAATKIRAKYLRALENEEFGLLPGPTFAKTFLRTYAEYLGLDAQLLVEEYRVQHEPRGEEIAPISARAGGGNRSTRRGGGRAPVGPPGPAVVFGAIFVLLLAVILVLGFTGENSNDNGDTGSTDGQQARDESAAKQRARERKRAKRARERKQRQRALASTVRLQIIGTGDVNVCLKAGDRTLVNGATLGAGDRTARFNSKRFRLTLGNNNAILRINGKDRRVKASADPIGLTITPARGRQPLPASRRPVCR
jgi:hypothetical protein